MELGNIVSEEKSEKEEIKSFAKFGNIKADYFLRKIFCILERKRTLEIVKKNKNIKERTGGCGVIDIVSGSEFDVGAELFPGSLCYGAPGKKPR